MPPRILLVEDEPSLAAALEIALRRSGYALDTAASGRAALDRLASQPWDAVVLDIGLPDLSGLDILAAIRRDLPNLPVLVITAHGHLDNAIAARKAGASDYMVKPLDLRQFQASVASLIESSRPLSPANSPSPRPASPLFVGGAPALQRAFAAIARACASHDPAIITGPSGSGKSLTAAIIHERSPRAAHPCTTVPASSITDAAALLASLDANPDGSLILDHLESLPTPAQDALASLLRNRPKGPRLIATASSDLRDAIRLNRFREDLYYQFSPGEIPLPPLHERRSDIPALCAALAPPGPHGPPEFTSSALAALQSWPWPGNVTELRHVLAYATHAAAGSPILRSHLPTHIAAAPPGSSTLDHALTEWLADPAIAALSWDGLVAALESRLLAQLLPRFDHKPTRLASALGIHRSTLRQKLARMTPDDGDAFPRI
jgi:DNA-binding NtrC family response regulator